MPAAAAWAAWRHGLLGSGNLPKSGHQAELENAKAAEGQPSGFLLFGAVWKMAGWMKSSAANNCDRARPTAAAHRRSDAPWPGCAISHFGAIAVTVLAIHLRPWVARGSTAFRLHGVPDQLSLLLAARLAFDGLQTRRLNEIFGRAG